MQQFCTYGSVRGASGNRRPYRDKAESGEFQEAGECCSFQFPPVKSLALALRALVAI